MAQSATDLTLRAQIEKNYCESDKRIYRTDPHGRLRLNIADIEKLVAPDPAHGKDYYLAPSQYCVSEVVEGTTATRYFHVIPDTGIVVPLANYVRENYPPAAAVVADGLQEAVRPELEKEKFQKELSSAQTWNKLMMGAMLYITARQMGMTQWLDSVVSQTVNAIIETPKRLVRGDLGGVAQVWKKIFKASSPIVRDFTDEVRKANVPLTDAAREILAGFDRGSLPHVQLTGPSGGGKGHAVRAAAAAAVRGVSGVEAFEGQPVRYVRISASQIVKNAGSWMNKGEQLFFQAIDRYAGNGPVIVHLTEADQFAAAGMGPGNQPLNLLSRIYDIMEGTDPRYRNLHFILDSTRWEEIRKAAPDIPRRAAKVEIVPPLVTEVRKALDDGIQWRRSGGEGAIPQRRYSRATFTPEALDAIAALGSFADGAPPSSHLSVMDEVVASAVRASGPGQAPVQVTAQNVVDFVAGRANRPLAEVQAEWASVQREGLAGHVRVQQGIEEGFYRAYPNPINGRQTRIPGGAAAVQAPQAPAPSARVASSSSGAPLTGAGLETALKANFRSWDGLAPGVKDGYQTRLATLWEEGTPAMRWAYRDGKGVDVARLARDFHRIVVDGRGTLAERAPTDVEKRQDAKRLEREMKQFRGGVI